MPQETTKFDFNDLFIFEMANNHQGVFEHGLRIIRAMASVARKTGVRGALKLQFRDLDTIVHPLHRENSDNRFVKRFMSTKLSDEQLRQYVEETHNAGLLSMCTPFDEASVDQIEKFGIQIIKVASSSANDWSLLERVAAAKKPVVCSTGALKFKNIDRLVDFLEKRGVDFALMHCVSIYPTPNHMLALNQIELMRKRYPHIAVGFSTHEDPSNPHVIRVAYAKGARLFEKHVGIPSPAISLNAYSATPEQVEMWINAWKEAKEACGNDEEREVAPEEERDARSFMRGIYVAKDIPEGIKLGRHDVFFAIPVMDGQLTSNQWREGLVAHRNYKKHEPITMKSVVICGSQRYMKEINEFAERLRFLGVPHVLVPDFEFEYSESLYTKEEKERMQSVAYRKRLPLVVQKHMDNIRRADVCYIYNKDGYLGVNTTLELGLAHGKNMAIYAFEPEKPGEEGGEICRHILYSDIVKAPEDLVKKLI